ncbi:hypothetical protein BBJ28_00026339, partial [Nothophytophthora sp. Chile5]
MATPHDRRGSSIAADVDAAIERVVSHFESNDLALRMDVLRALSAQSRLAFETARVRERLAQHPVSMDLLSCVTTQSPVYKQLAERLAVESCSCDYDARRNAVMSTSVRWTQPSRASSSSQTKKRRKTAGATTSAAAAAPLITHYKYERVLSEKEEGGQETLVRFTMVVAFGDEDATPKELLHFEMACESAYPRSYYEEQQQLESEDEGEGGEEAGVAEKQEAQNGETKAGGGDAAEEEAEEEGETFGEELRAFRFDDAVLAKMAQWMGAVEEQLDPVDVVGFFLALPVCEDEWMVDERVCDIL